MCVTVVTIVYRYSDVKMLMSVIILCADILIIMLIIMFGIINTMSSLNTYCQGVKLHVGYIVMHGTIILTEYINHKK